MLDIEKLLLELEGDTTCGENLEYDPLILESREAMEGKPEQQIGDDVIEGEEPDWKTVKKNGLELCERTHSLEVYISLVRALMNLDGYAGLAESSKLLESAIGKYWTCIHPQLDPDDDDPTERLNMLAIFDDFNFLLTLQKIQILQTKGVGSVSLYDIRNTNTNVDDENIIDEQLISAVFNSCSEEDKQQAFSYLDQCSSNFQNISTLLQEEETVGAANAPSFSELLKILNEAKSAVGSHLGHETEDSFDEGEVVATNSSFGNSANMNSSGISSRQDVIQSLEKIEEYYLKNEPGSPIPLLLQRAKSLVNKDFITLMEELSPDSLHQLEMIFGRNQSHDE